MSGALFVLLSIAFAFAASTIMFPGPDYRYAVEPFVWTCQLGGTTALIYSLTLVVLGIALLAVWLWTGNVEDVVLRLRRRVGLAADWGWDPDSGFYRPKGWRRK